MIYYTTVRVQSVIGNEHSAIDKAIETGLNVLTKEAGVPVLLTNVITVPLQSCLCVTVLARKPEGQEQGSRLMEVLKSTGWGPETTEGTEVRP